MTQDDDPAASGQGLERYVPLVVWMIAILLLLAIPFKILRSGYMPRDDALRYSALAVSGKTWPEVVVLGDSYKMDHNFGWDFIVRRVYLLTHWDTEALLIFSTVALFALLGLSALPWLKRQEAWLAALALCSIMGNFAAAATFARPFLLTMAMLVTVLCMWYRHGNSPPGWRIILGLTLPIALSVFIHGAWYLWLLAIVSLACAQNFRWALALAAAWVLGTILGAAFTGHPLTYVLGAINMGFQAVGSNQSRLSLVSEFQPAQANPFVIFVLAGLFFVRQLTKCNERPLTRNPAFWLVCIGLLLGFKAERFWDDWGFPALMVLVAFDLQRLFEISIPSLNSPKRLVLTSGLALTLYLATTSDIGGRWTNSLHTPFLAESNPELKGWLPDKGGIFYSADMYLFYQTFFKNPRADWRYMLGFEPTLMPADDLRTYHLIMWNYGDSAAYKGWVEKMRPADRLAIHHPPRNPPEIPELEWNCSVGDIWLGRLRATNAADAESITKRRNH